MWTSNGKIMVTGRQVRQVGTEEFFFTPQKKTKMYLSSEYWVRFKLRSRFRPRIHTKRL